MTEKDYPNSTELPKSEISEDSSPLEAGIDSSETPFDPSQLDFGGLESLDLPTIPEPPAEPTIMPFPYVAPPGIVQKMHALTQQKKEEAAERERLASMPKQPYRREEPRVGRNDPCPCGSGKKYKKCHMGKDLEES